MEVDGSIRLFDQPYRLDVQRSPTNASAPAAPSRVPPSATPAAVFAWTSTVWMPGSVCVEEVEVVRVQGLEEQSKRFGIRARYNAVFVGGAVEPRKSGFESLIPIAVGNPRELRAEPFDLLRGERIIPVVCEDVKQRLREKGVTTFVTIPHSP